MNVLIIGSGGREHALAKVISKSKLLNRLCVIPGNPGIEKLAKCIDIDPFNNELIKEFCIKEDINLIIPGSESFLENGIADAFEDTDIRVFGPNKKAALIESSKEYAKDLMEKYDIPSAKYRVFSDFTKACDYVEKQGVPIVLKYDGLAAGKGVVVATSTKEAFSTLDIMLNDKLYGDSKVVIEECLVGPEYSLMTFVHNEHMITMPIAQDHKRLLDGDLGPNTGGMGIYSSVPIIPDEELEYAKIEIMEKTVRALLKEDNNFTGFLYGGLMMTKEGSKVIEFNARFGDPEAEVILPRLETDFLELINSLFNNEPITPSWDDQFHLGVVLASKGYPNHYDKGFLIEGLEEIEDNVFHMGTKKVKETIVTNGGRVLLITGCGKTLELAYQNAYNNVNKIKCENLTYRKDIGFKALKG